VVSRFDQNYDALVRTWALLGIGIAAAAMAAALVGACSSGGRMPHSGMASGAARVAAGSAPTSPVAATSPPPASPASGGDAGGALDASTASAAAELGATPSDCREPRVRLLLPDGGVVFNNAMTSADAGLADRTQGVLDALGAQADRFRCCFNPWASDTPGGRAELLLVVDLEPDGRVREATVDADRSTISRADTIRCVLDVARQTSFPASPAGRPTLAEVPLLVAVDSSG
jgi:hypothetical protein